MTGLTPRQAEALRFVETFAARTGASPSYQQIADALGYRTRSAAHRVIDGLKDRGRLENIPGRARTLRPRRLTLTPEQEQRVIDCAQRRAIEPEDLLADIIDQAIDWRETRRDA